MSDSLLALHHGVVYQAKQHMEHLHLLLAQFNQFWVPLAQSAIIYPLPVAQKDSPLNVPWLPSLDQIEFETLNGQSAIDVATHAVSNFKRYPEDAALNIRRWPGFVRLPKTAHLELTEKLNLINQTKNALKTVIGALPDGSRPLVLKKTFPGEHILAAYRHIHHSPQDVDTLSFTWVGKTAKNTPIDKTEVINRLEVERDKLDADDISAIARINQEIDLVHNTHQSLIERKRHAPSPQLAVFFSNSASKKQWDMLVPLSLPFFIAQDHEPDFNGLPFWNNEETKKGSRSVKYQAIIERAGIFVKN